MTTDEVSGIQSIYEKIKQRRRQLLVHSYIYYELDESIISDSKWSKWAMELVELQRNYPEESKQVEFYDMFKDWDGSSGAFLNYTQGIINCAERLLRIKSPVKPKPKKSSGTKRLF